MASFVKPFFSASLFLVFAACSDTTAPISLSLNRALWEKQNLHDYSYIGRRDCFCGDAGQDVYVVVLSDTVFQVRVVGTNVELPKGYWLTVGQPFDYAERSFGEKDKTVKVEYDPALSYPTLVDVQCPMVADCGVTIRARNLGGLVVAFDRTRDLSIKAYDVGVKSR